MSTTRRHCSLTTTPPRDALEQVLDEAPLFDGLSDAERRRALARFDEQRFGRGHRLVTEGMHGQEFFIVLEGRADVVRQGNVIAQLGPGDFFGEIGVLSGLPRSADVVAATPLRTLVLSNNQLDRVLVEVPLLGVNLLHEVALRYRDGATGAAGLARRGVRAQ